MKKNKQWQGPEEIKVLKIFGMEFSNKMGE